MRTRGQRAGRVAGAASVVFVMAFAPAGPEAWLFDALERHRASLLAAVRRGAGESPAAGSRPASSSEVLTSIENIIQDIVESLARKEVPTFTIDDRSRWGNMMFEDSVGLQMIPQCTTRKIRSDSPKSIKKFALILKILSMIYKLVQTNSYATKSKCPPRSTLCLSKSKDMGLIHNVTSRFHRDIYYTDSQLFGNQTSVDSIVDDISCMLKVPRRSLHVLSTSKGLIAGNLRYMEEDGTRVQCACSATATAVPSNIQGIRNLITDAKFLLIVEKDATFQRLLDDNFCSRMSPCIMVTGKGIPDLNTRLLVKKLWDTFHIPVFTLVDADPHGIEIMCIYKYGSMSMSFEAHSLTVPAVRWLGLLPSDIKRLNIPKDSLIPLTKHDQMKLDSILRRPYITYQPFWRKELETMADSKMKAEIQALTLLSADYLSRVYLPNKLRFGGWI